MTNTTPTEPGKPRRWLVPALLISAAANLLVIGVLGEPFFHALPEPQRREMLREITGNREAFREGREALRARFESFLAALRADTFDRALVGDLLDQQSQAALRRQELGEQLLLDRLAGTTQAEREAYADALEERLKGFRRR